jgi:hypothetical protein
MKLRLHDLSANGAEYLVSVLSHRGESAPALALILAALDESVSPAAGLNRELLDTGIRLALHCNDTISGLRLARASQSLVSDRMQNISPL